MQFSIVSFNLTDHLHLHYQQRIRRLRPNYIHPSKVAVSAKDTDHIVQTISIHMQDPLECNNKLSHLIFLHVRCLV